MLTTAQKIDVGNISSVLVSNYLKSGRTIRDTPKRDHPYLTFGVRQALEWLYDYDPTNADLELIGNYLISICYAEARAEAILAIGGGGSVSPITPSGGFSFDYLIPILGGVPQFANATDINDSRIIGKNLEVFWNDIPRFLQSGEWAYTPTGIRILVAGFDATVNTYDFKIFIRNPFVSNGTGQEVTRGYQFTGTTGSEISFYSALLDGSTIVSVESGTDYTIENTTTPTGMEVLVTLNAQGLSTGTITFASDNPIAVDEVVTVIFSKAT